MSITIQKENAPIIRQSTFNWKSLSFKHYQAKSSSNQISNIYIILEFISINIHIINGHQKRQADREKMWHDNILVTILFLL